MMIKLKEVLVVLCLVLFIVMVNRQTTYAEVSVDEIMEAISRGGADLGEMEEFSPTEIKRQFGININDYQGVAYYGHVSIMESETLLVVCLQDKDQGEGIMDTITEQRDELMKLFQSYAPDQYELLRSSVLVQKGNYLLYVVSEEAKAVESAFVDCITE